MALSRAKSQSSSITAVAPSASLLCSPIALQLWNDALAYGEETMKRAIGNDIPGSELQSSSSALIDYTSSLHGKYAQKGSTKTLQFLSPFLLRLKAGAPAIDVFVQSGPSVIGLLWGSIRLALQFSLESVAIMDSFLQMLEMILSSFPRYDTYVSLLSTDNDCLCRAMTKVFVEVVEFCGKAIEHFKRPPMKNLIRSALRPMDNEMQHCISSIKQHAIDVEREAFACTVKADEARFRELHDLLTQTKVRPSLRLPCHCLAYPRNPRFYLREEALRAITNHFASSDNQRSFSLWGLGGVGKTQVANHYLHEAKDEFEVIFWCHSDTTVKLLESFVRFAIYSGLQEAGTDANKCREVVLEWLQSTSTKWLVVFDNADTFHLLRDFWPRSNSGRILLTSRNPSTSLSPVQGGYEIATMSSDEASSLLVDQLLQDRLQIACAPDEEVVHAVVAELGYLPLAIVQVAAFTLETACDLSDTLRFLNDRNTQAQLFAHDGLGVFNFYDSPTAAAWDLSISALGEEARNLLSLLSFLDPDSIPDDLLHAQVDSSDFGFRSSIGTGLSQKRALGGLLRYSLIRKNQGHNSFTIHRLVQSASISKMDNESRSRAFDGVVKLLYHVFPRQELGCPMEKDWIKCRLYINHVLAAEKCYRDYGISSSAIENLVEILFNCGWYMFEQGLYNEAGPILRSAQEEISRISKGDGLLAADVYAAQGSILLEQNKSQESYTSYSRALEIHQRLLHPNHVHLANSYMNAANALNGLRRFDESLQFHLKAVAIREKSPHLARAMLGLSYGNMGRLFMRMGRLDEAAEVLVKSIQVRRETMGPKSSKLANALHALGNVYIAQNCKGAAYDLHHESWQIRMEVLGDSHQTAASCHKLAWHFKQRKEYDNATQLLEHAIKIYRTYGEEEGGIARSQYLLSMVLRAQGRGPEADLVKEQAGRLREKILHLEPEENDDLASYDELIMFVDH